ncbi:MAG: zf-TFIIB domain-containing protein [Candidatus Moranbacteria bacterium]|nr:zf-TFIIB domain-containing protein [bacterium]MDP1834063.1 zf-TFIIB domain-containing protein [Candidatus Moranbacteria bacterium]MDZ4385003.1 zf-TFIIB domain-containing protein [Candidatus Moranbacteria bacterium]
MKCPMCNVNLQMTERQGIEIDYCPQCRGIWLDRGELDKIIEKSAASSPILGSNVEMRTDNQREHDDRGGHYSGDGYRYGKKHKKESLLGELFDF